MGQISVSTEEPISRSQSLHTEEDEYRSPEQFLDIETSEDGISAWQQALDNWPRSQYTRKLKLMTRKGIPSKLRGECWSKAIANTLQLTPQLFTLLLTRAQNLEGENRDANGAALIPLDLSRTLNSLQVFQREQPLHQAVSDVLEAFAVFRPDIGYVQGMAYLTAMMALHLSPYKTFECFANIICKSEILRVFYLFDLEGIQEYYRIFEFFLAKKAPKVAEKFTLMAITPDIYLLDWIYTLFSRALSFDIMWYGIHRSSVVFGTLFLLKAILSL